MPRYLGTLFTVGARGGHDEDQMTFDSYTISQVGNGGLLKITFDNGISVVEDEDDVPLHEILLAASAFVSFGVTEIPTVTITKAEYDSLKETAEILADSETIKDIRESLLELVTSVAKEKADRVEDGMASIPAAELARLRKIAESAEAALIQDLADEAEAGYDPDKLVARQLTD